jgi:hypothetical protein
MQQLPALVVACGGGEGDGLGQVGGAEAVACSGGV